MAKEIPECLINVEVAAALNELLYRTSGLHPNPGFRCPKCLELVEPHHGKARGKKRLGHHFEHKEDKGCPGPESWGRPKKR